MFKDEVTMHIFLSAGEPSGDQHAAHLMAELRRQRPDVTFSGFGGERMEQAGGRLLYRLTDLAVMFIVSAVPHLRTFLRLIKQAGRYFQENRPDAVVLVDFPGFNWHIARKAKAAGIPVFFYLPPQLWAWGPWRAKKMRKFVDYVLSGLPFEPEWYGKRGITAEYVGHPFFDEIAEHRLDGKLCASLRSAGKPVLGVLPGSRDKEIDRNWPIMLQVLQRVRERIPHVRFEVASYNRKQRDRCRELLESLQNPRVAARQSPRVATRQSPRVATRGFDMPLVFHVGKTPEVIESADCCLMVSGSVSLEMLARTKPAAVVYSLTRIANVFKRFFLNVDYITLPNLFAGKAVLPEWVIAGPPNRAVAEISETLSGWLSDESLREKQIAELRTLRDKVMRTGASRNTAAAILRRVKPMGSDPWALPSDRKLQRAA